MKKIYQHEFLNKLKKEGNNLPIQLDLTYKKKDGTNITIATGLNSASMNENYRYVKFEKPATGNLLAWFETNAVRLPLTRTWVFNNVISNTNAPWDLQHFFYL